VKQLSVRTTASTLARGAHTRRCFEAIRQAAVPVIAAVNGPALGAGMMIASVCDLIVASERASFGLPEVNVGALGAARHVARILPEKVMRQMALTGVRFDAWALERLGAVNLVVPHAELLARAYEIADGIASKSPSLMRLRKEAMNLVEEMPLAAGYCVEQLYTTVAAEIPDAREAARSVVEKRRPNWSA
jgi:enoyl-CoA hydratase